LITLFIIYRKVMKEFIRYILKENLPKTGMVLNESVQISEGLEYMIRENITLDENIYRPYSDEYFNLINEVRDLYENNKITLCGDDEWLVRTDVGKTAIYEGDTVWLDIPFEIEDEEYIISEAEYRGRKVKLNSPFRTPGGPKKFAVYVKNDKGNVVKVTFGDPNLRVRNNDPGARKSFRARHKCDQKKDRTKAGYWSCNVARYRKQLGIKSSSPW
jgi:hypothetical protein